MLVVYVRIQLLSVYPITPVLFSTFFSVQLAFEMALATKHSRRQVSHPGYLAPLTVERSMELKLRADNHSTFILTLSTHTFYDLMSSTYTLHTILEACDIYTLYTWCIVRWVLTVGMEGWRSHPGDRPSGKYSR